MRLHDLFPTHRRYTWKTAIVGLINWQRVNKTFNIEFPACFICSVNLISFGGLFITLPDI